MEKNGNNKDPNNTYEEIYFPSFIGETIDKITAKESMNTSTDQQWTHLDVGTASFVTCIILFCICFSYLIPSDSEIKLIALIIALCVTFLFPLSWATSIVQYPDKPTKYYVLVCVFVGVIFEFVTLLMTALTTNVAQTRASTENSKLSPDEVNSGKKFVISPFIVSNNEIIYALFTTSTVLMIGCIATYFYDEVTIENQLISNGVNMEPGSTMGTNIQWWMSFVYNRINDLDTWWHGTVNMIPIPAIIKMFFLFAIGFLIIFFIFVNVNLMQAPPAEKVNNLDDYTLDSSMNINTSKPNTNSPLMQNGMYLLYGKKPAPIRVTKVTVNYLPNTFTPSNYNINLPGLLSFFMTLLICILIVPVLYGLNSLFGYFNANFLDFLFNPIPITILLVVTFLLSFLLFYFYFPTNGTMDIIYFLITFVFAVLSAPFFIMFLEIIFTCFGNSLSKTNWGWTLSISSLILIWWFTFDNRYSIFDPNNAVKGDKDNSTVLQILTVFLIALTVGWFFALSFHFDVFSFLFALIFSPIKYVLKTFGPITILALTITQIIIASANANKQGKTTAG